MSNRDGYMMDGSSGAPGDDGSNTGMPKNAFDVPGGRGVLQRHIDAGEITHEDLELVQSAYRTMSLASTVSTAVLGVGSWVFLKRRNPKVTTGMRLLLSGGLGTIGGTIGFAVAGAAESMRISASMPDYERKLEVFKEIGMEQREAIIEARRQHAGRGAIPSHQAEPYGTIKIGKGAAGAGGGSSDPWDVDGSGSRERSAEADREKGMQDATVARMQGGGAKGGVADQVKRETGSTWDKIRSERPGAGAQGQYGQPRDGVIGSRLGGDPMAGMGMADGGAKEDSRSAEQKAFDEMLERERRGVESDTFK